MTLRGDNTKPVRQAIGYPASCTASHDARMELTVGFAYKPTGLADSGRFPRVAIDRLQPLSINRSGRSAGRRHVAQVKSYAIGGQVKAIAH